MQRGNWTTIIHSFKHFYIAPLQETYSLRGTPSQAVAKEKWIKRFIESRQIIPDAS